MKDSFARWCSRHATALIAFAVTLVFTIRFLNTLPFSGYTRLFNYETVMSLVSVFIYNREPFSFPLGSIKGLTFPFEDANVGNVGAIPLFAVLVKALGKLIPFFRTFDYFVAIEIVSCFASAFFSQRILILLGVERKAILAFGSLITATSFIVFNRSDWMQPFCVAAFPIYMAWIYAMLKALARGKWCLRQDAATLLIFPIAALIDNYTLVGLLLATGALVLRESFEAIFGGKASSRNRLIRLLSYCILGVGFILFSLYLVGMYPLPPVPYSFTSYDFGMGGRYHVADLLSPILPPVSGGNHTFAHSRLFGRIGTRFSTLPLGGGQSDGAGYIGSAALLIWFSVVIAWAFSFLGREKRAEAFRADARGKLRTYSPWGKVALAAGFVFTFSLGYELHIMGATFPNFTGMPGAWISDRFSSLYNIRSPGRLIFLFSIFLMLEATRRLSQWTESSRLLDAQQSRPLPLSTCVIGTLFVLHLLEIAPYLKPISSQPLKPIGGIFSETEIRKLKELGQGHKAVLIGPSALAAGGWTGTAFILSYYLGIPSNLYYIARVFPAHFYTTTADVNELMAGNWDQLRKQYGSILFAMPLTYAEKIREQVQQNYIEARIGTLSIWSARRTEK